MFTQLLIPLSLCIATFMAPGEDGYTIQIPRNIEVNESGTISISMVENHLAANEELSIVFEDSFTLNDAHGKDSISGTLNENTITFDADDHGSKAVSYTIGEIPVGEWQGDMDINISLLRHLPSNVLIPGPQLNNILKRIRPNIIRFSHQPQSGDYDYDVSLAADESILLYIVSADEVIITNSQDLPITANENMADAFREVDSLIRIEGLDLVDFTPCTDVSMLFADDVYLEEIDGLGEIETRNIGDMSFMFKDNHALNGLDLSNWNTASLSNIKGMFNNCTALTAISLDDWCGTMLQDMSYLFAGCVELLEADVSSLHTSAVEDMSYLFYGCDKLSQLDLSDWQTDSCRFLFNAFSGCQSLSSIGDLSSWNTENVQGFDRLFDGCRSLTAIGDLEDWDTSAVANMAMMFRGCSSLRSIGDISGWNVENVESFASMFEGARNLSGFGDLGIWNVSESCLDLSGMFKDTYDILGSTMDLRSWDISNVSDMSEMFRNCFSLTSLNIQDWNCEKLVDASAMFECIDSSKTSRLTSISGIENLDTSSLENISRIFYDNRNLSADLSGWNTANLQDISYAFYGTWNFPINNLESWDISSISDMSEAFGNNAGRRARSDPPSWYY